MKKYKVFQEQTITKIGFLMAKSKEDAQRKAEDIDWDSIEEEDLLVDYTVSSYLEDEEIMMESLRLDEGWIICYDTENECVILQRDDDRNIFSNDSEAILHVVIKMLKGSNVHARAFRFVYNNASAELRDELRDAVIAAVIEMTRVL